jgi:CRISPR-associated endonuclease/helicase Cas3
MSNTVCDLSFSISNGIVPLDHGYILYSALSNIIPEIHFTKTIGVHPFSGKKITNSKLLLTNTSKLKFRCKFDDIKLLSDFSGRIIKINDCEFRLGNAVVNILNPSASLFSRKVVITIPNLEKEIKDFDQFIKTYKQSIVKQLDNLNIKYDLNMLGRQRIYIKDKVILGFSIEVNNLSNSDSIILQENGIGGRHKMGCGIFKFSKKDNK